MNSLAPSPGFRRGVSETHPRRRIRDANEMLVGRKLNLPARKLGFTLQRLDARLAAHERPEPRLVMQAEPVKTIKLKPAEAPDETAEQTLGRYQLLEQVRGVGIL